MSEVSLSQNKGVVHVIKLILLFSKGTLHFSKVTEKFLDCSKKTFFNHYISEKRYLSLNKNNQLSFFKL